MRCTNTAVNLVDVFKTDQYDAPKQFTPQVDYVIDVMSISTGWSNRNEDMRYICRY